MPQDMHAIMTVLGARPLALNDREKNDFYATDPEALELILPEVNLSHDVWEPACGKGHLAQVLQQHGYNVRASDLIDRGYGEGGVDFFDVNEAYDGDIVTNPPYGKLALPFIEKALDVVTDGHIVMCFLKLTFLASQGRGKFYRENPPRYVYVSRRRIHCALNGDFETYKNKPTAIDYAWFVWQKGFKGETTVRWFN